MTYSDTTWDTIRDVALKLGATEEAVRKWRERKSVPGKWHARLVMASRGRLKVAHFAAEAEEAA